MTWLGPLSLLLLVLVLLPVLTGSGLFGWLLWSRARWIGYHRFKGAPARAPGFGALLGELRSAGWLLWWRLGWRGSDRWIRPPGAEAGPPVLCVHGFTQDASNFRRLRKALAERGRPSLAVSLGRPLRPVERHAERLTTALRLLAREHRQVDVVAHSMGGIVLRYVLSRDPELRPLIRTVITLGTPHQGTASARGARGLPERPILARRSPWLATLPTLGALVPEAQRVTVAGGADLVVYPRDTCHEPDAQQVDLPQIGHAGLLTRPESIEVVLEALGDSTPEAKALDQEELLHRR